jgi:probable F420-dependent oxidoreductase
VQFAVKLPNFSALGGRDSVVRFAKLAEELGYDTLWSSDHVIVPEQFSPLYPYSPTGMPDPAWPHFVAADPIVTLSVAAGCTERIRLGVLLVLPYRNPLLTAKMLASLDMCAPGRVLLLGMLGWMQEEFEVLDAPDYKLRGKVSDEWIEILRRCWSDELVSFEGEHYSFPPVYFNPRPASPIPIWIAGNSEPAFRRTGRVGDGWLAPGAGVRSARASIARIREHAEAAGRDPDSIVMGAQLDAELKARSGEGERYGLAGSASELAERLADLQDAGLQHVNLVFRSIREVPSLEATFEQMEGFAKDVVPSIRR